MTASRSMDDTAHWPSVDGLRHLGARLIGDELLIVPVRHHSPACAWHVQRLIRERRPSVVLVEGPRSFDALVPLLGHPQARLPLAVYTYAVEQARDPATARRQASYYPFCEYSPEWVALREAQALGVPVRFIDLDYTEQCALERRAQGAEDQDPDDDDEADDEADAPAASPPPASPDRDTATALLDERRFSRSRHLQLLAQRLGCRGHEELWEHLFEVDAARRDSATHVAQVAAYCELARRDSTPEALERDGTLAREAEMAWHTHAALRARQPGDGPVLVVVGGFHAVVLPDLLDAGGDVPQRPALPPLNVAESGTALIRYGFDRLERLNGYTAGMTAPAWHQRVWEGLQRQAKIGQAGSARVREEAALALLFDVATELRERHGLALPMPALRAAYEQTLQLAALRQRAAPARDDVLDAITSCFIKGEVSSDGALVMAVARRALTGTAMGQVPPGAGRPPLVPDFEQRARRQKLRIDDAEPRRVVLDLYRRPEHRITSRLLHGLTLLDVPFARRLGGPDFVAGTGLERLQEQWEYSYSPLTEGALVEAAVLGPTVPQAVAARFLARLERHRQGGQTLDARTGAVWMVQACVLGLHDHLPRLAPLLQAAIAADPSFDSVARAARSLGLLWESREPLEARDADLLPPLLRAAFERAAYLLRGLPAAVPDEATLLTGLSGLRELLISQAGSTTGAGLDPALYWHAIQALRNDHPHPLVRGACAGLLHAEGGPDAPDLAVAVAGHLRGLAVPREAVDYLRGLLAMAREAAWQQPALLAAVDDAMASWDEATFLAVLPVLRLAFSTMTPKETDRIAESVTALHGGGSLGALARHDLTADEVQRMLGWSVALTEVLAEDGLAGWVP